MKWIAVAACFYCATVLDLHGRKDPSGVVFLIGLLIAFWAT